MLRARDGVACKCSTCPSAAGQGQRDLLGRRWLYTAGGETRRGRRDRGQRRRKRAGDALQAPGRCRDRQGRGGRARLHRLGAPRSRRRRHSLCLAAQGHRQHHERRRAHLCRSAAGQLDRDAAGAAAGGREAIGGACAQCGTRAAGSARRFRDEVADGAGAHIGAADLRALHLRTARRGRRLLVHERSKAGIVVRRAADLRSRRRAARRAGLCRHDHARDHRQCGVGRHRAGRQRRCARLSRGQELRRRRHVPAVRQAAGAGQGVHRDAAAADQCGEGCVAARRRAADLRVDRATGPARCRARFAQARHQGRDQNRVPGGAKASACGRARGGRHAAPGSARTGPGIGHAGDRRQTHQRCAAPDLRFSRRRAGGGIPPRRRDVAGARLARADRPCGDPQGGRSAGRRCQRDHAGRRAGDPDSAEPPAARVARAGRAEGGAGLDPDLCRRQAEFAAAARGGAPRDGPVARQHHGADGRRCQALSPDRSGLRQPDGRRDGVGARAGLHPPSGLNRVRAA